MTEAIETQEKVLSGKVLSYTNQTWYGSRTITCPSCQERFPTFHGEHSNLSDLEECPFCGQYLSIDWIPA